MAHASFSSCGRYIAKKEYAMYCTVCTVGLAQDLLGKLSLLT